MHRIDACGTSFCYQYYAHRSIPKTALTAIKKNKTAAMYTLTYRY